MSIHRSVPVVLLALLVAGCAGKPAAERSASLAPTSTDPYALPDGASNILRGKVLGPDQTPLGETQVEVLGLNLTRLTNEAGQYQFQDLEPRDWLIVASKDGYKTKTQRAVIEDGKIFELDFQMDEKPVLTPYNETVIFKGLISCQAAYATNPENVAYQDCGAADPNNKPARDFTLSTHGAQVQVEATWEAKTQAATSLSMQIESIGFGHQDLIFGRQSGPSGIKMVISQTLLEKYYAQGGQMRVSMSPAPSITGDEAPLDAGLAFQQDFTLYFTVFYVEPGSNGFTAIPA